MLSQVVRLQYITQEEQVFSFIFRCVDSHDELNLNLLIHELKNLLTGKELNM